MCIWEDEGLDVRGRKEGQGGKRKRCSEGVSVEKKGWSVKKGEG